MGLYTIATMFCELEMGPKTYRAGQFGLFFWGPCLAPPVQGGTCVQPSAAGPGHCSHPEWGWEPGTDSEPWPWAPSHGLRVGEGFPWAAGSSVRHFGADEYAAQQRAFCFRELRVGCARQNCCLFFLVLTSPLSWSCSPWLLGSREMEGFISQM